MDIAKFSGGLSFSFILRWKFCRSSVTYYLYAPSLGSFPPRLKKKYGALTFYVQICKFESPRSTPQKRKFKKRAARQRQINLHAVQQLITCSGVREGLGEGLSRTVTSAKREVKEGDAS